MANPNAFGGNLIKPCSPAAISPKSGDIFKSHGEDKPLFGHIAQQQAVVESCAAKSPFAALFGVKTSVSSTSALRPIAALQQRLTR